MSRRLAVIVATDPAGGDLDSARLLASAALDQGIEVGLFLMDRAVAALHRPAPLIELAHRGCDIVACEVSTERGAVPALPAEVRLGSQDDHARMVARADRVLAFT